MRRYAEDRKVIARRRKFIDAFNAGRGLTEFNRYNIDGRLRKRKPLDCGQTRCSCCHHDKMGGHTETKQERSSRMKMQETLE
jgi:hypothetical protein